ncbi:MAG: hypothetical protein ABIS51_20295 [Sphingomonas sp.]
MSPALILVGIYGALFTLTVWFQQRLRSALAERHPGALHIIDSMARSSARSRRGVDRVARYRLLQDPEIDRHIRNVSRMETVLGYAILVFFALVLVIMVASAMPR